MTAYVNIEEVINKALVIFNHLKLFCVINEYMNKHQRQSHRIIVINIMKHDYDNKYHRY